MARWAPTPDPSSRPGGDCRRNDEGDRGSPRSPSARRAPDAASPGHGSRSAGPAPSRCRAGGRAPREMARWAPTPDPSSRPGGDCRRNDEGDRGSPRSPSSLQAPIGLREPLGERPTQLLQGTVLDLPDPLLRDAEPVAEMPSTASAGSTGSVRPSPSCPNGSCASSTSVGWRRIRRLSTDRLVGQRRVVDQEVDPLRRGFAVVAHRGVEGHVRSGHTSSAQKALFFNLRRLRARLMQSTDERVGDEIHRPGSRPAPPRLRRRRPPGR
jgi:hypothetical protein